MPKHTAGKPQEFTLIPAQEWTGHVDEIRVALREDGNETWNIAFKIEDEGEFFGRTIWDSIIFGLPQCAWKIDQFIAATMGALAEGEQIDMQPENFYQLPCCVKSYIDIYQGEKKGKIKTWIPQPADGDEGPTAVVPGDATKTVPTGTAPAGQKPAIAAPAKAVLGKNPTF